MGQPLDQASQHLVIHLGKIGVGSCIWESSYLDKDFSHDYLAFYAHTFRAPPKECKRIHFFRGNITDSLDAVRNKPSQWHSVLDQDAYLGFAVIRPLTNSPLGRTNIIPPPDEGRRQIMLQSHHEANLLGSRLTVECMPFIQQDTRVGVCAQAAMWMTGRYLHCRRKEGWYSVADITRFATDPLDANLITGLPAGANGLTLDHIARAYKAMGYQPLAFMARRTDSDEGRYIWPDGVSPRRIIARLFALRPHPLHLEWVQSE